MTPKKITVEDLKEQAEGIRDTVREDAKEVLRQDTTKMVIAGVVTAVVVVSFAYYIGRRRCTCPALPNPPSCC